MELTLAASRPLVGIDNLELRPNLFLLVFTLRNAGAVAIRSFSIGGKCFHKPAEPGAKFEGSYRGTEALPEILPLEVMFTGANGLSRSETWVLQRNERGQYRITGRSEAEASSPLLGGDLPLQADDDDFATS
jgi:hypothetical protein